MKILITEDDPKKRDEFVRFATDIGVAEHQILVASDMAEFMTKFDETVDICLIDLRIPAYKDAPPERNGIGVLQAIERIGGGRVKLLAVSSYPDEFATIRCDFEARGCLLVDYNQKDVWTSVLQSMIVQAQGTEALDFLIFCALRLERSPFTAMPELSGKVVSRDNLMRYDISIGGKSGAVIELPRMGLVDAAATAAACIERYKPVIVAMPGICAGFQGQAILGQLLISELAYEYQSGKWTADGFAQEPYQVPISENVRTVARELIEDDYLLARLEEGLKSSRPTTMSTPKLATFTSGSAVIASEQFISQVSQHHRRVSGLDMEVFAIHRAAHIAHCNPDVICAKTVVDLAGGDKNDALQQYGAFVSARFIIKALESYFLRD